MAVTGIRGGEALALDDEDFDPGRGLLLVRHAKLGRHRLLPLHPTTVTAVQAYRQLRDRHFPRPHTQALLVSSTGTRLIYYNVGRGQQAGPGEPPSAQATAAPGRMI
jgi:integrase